MKMRLVTIDVETYWSKDYSLTKLTPIEYVKDPRFELMSLAIKEDDEPTQVWWGQHAIQKLREYYWGDALVIGHNMSGFDCLVLHKYGVNPRLWGCTLAMARHLGPDVPVGLAALAKRFNLEDKGNLEATNTKGKHLHELTKEEMRELETYNKKDVDITYGLWKELSKGFPRRELLLVDSTIRMLINPRLILSPTTLLKAKTKEDERRAGMKKVLSDLIGIPVDELEKTLSSSAKTKILLEKLGHEVPMKVSPTTGKEIPALAKTDKGMQSLLEHESPLVRTIAECRLNEKSTILSSRIDRLLRAVTEDNKLPVPLSYWGAAQTGRWSGSMSLNLQNLPRVSGDSPNDCLRNSIMAPLGFKLVVSDLSGIELRVNHFLWRQEDSIAIYNDDPKADLYRVFAAKFYNIARDEVTEPQRNFSKLCMLGLGYQTGVIKFKDQARQVGIILDHNQAAAAVNKWRQSHYAIVNGWDICRDVIPYIKEGTKRDIDPWGLFRTEKNAIRFLPRDTTIQYPNLRQTTNERGYPDWICGKNSKLFGGKMTEHLVSHLSRHVLSDVVLTILKEHQIHPSHLVHDEAIYVTTKGYANEFLGILNKEMCTSPKWWPELTTFSKGGVGDCYGQIK